MSHDVELREAAQDFQESLEQLHVGAVRYEENIPIEQDILHLKETLEFINSKLKAIKISDVSVEEKGYENVDIERKKTELIDNLSNSQLKDTALHTILTGHVLETVKNSSSSTIKIFKQKVIEQLELSKNNCKRTMKLYERQEEILNESCKASQIINKQTMFGNILQEKNKQYQQKCEDNFSDAYKQQMEIITQRINKINFMRTLTTRLIIYANIDMEKTPEFKEIIRDFRYPVSLKTLLEE